MRSLGDEQAPELNPAASNLHSKGLLGSSPMLSEPENVNLMEVEDVMPLLLMELPLPPLGTVAESMEVVGSVLSTIVHVKEAGDESLLPAASTALTWNVCEPADSPVMSLGEEQAAELNPAPSI